MLRSFGLRSLLLLGLAIGFVIASTVLAFTATSLSSRVREIDRRKDASTLAALLAEVADHPSFSVDSTIEHALTGGRVRGLRVVRGDERILRGDTRGAPDAEAKIFPSTRVAVFLSHEKTAIEISLTRIVPFYFFLTGLVVMLFTYLALTQWLVRPLERITEASERIAKGTELVHVPIEGARETARLGESLDSMAAQLRAERLALHARLRELETRTEELRNTQEQLVRSHNLAAVGRLSAGIAHEIGNPLAAILGLIELLRSGGLDETESKEFLERAQNETERIQRIIRELLDFARQGQAPVSEETFAVSLAECVDDAVRLVKPQKEMRDVTIDVSVDATLPNVSGTRDRLAQVLLNLFLNAGHAMNGNGKIAIHAENEGDFVCLSIHDSGPGIAPEVLDTLFEPFVTTKIVGEGTGLGLAVSHTLIERLGGSLTAKNSDAGGAVFELRLPIIPTRRSFQG